MRTAFVIKPAILFYITVNVHSLFKKLLKVTQLEQFMSPCSSAANIGIAFIHVAIPYLQIGLPVFFC